MRKKRAITILEIMIVIFLIGIIGGVIGVNMKGSMDKGKAFKTEQAIQRVKEILYLVASEEGKQISDIVKEPRDYLERSGLVKNVNDLMKDGWGHELSVSEENGEIIVDSVGLGNYKKKESGKEKAPKKK